MGKTIGEKALRVIQQIINDIGEFDKIKADRVMTYISLLVGADDRTINSHLNKLEGWGLFIKIGDGYYKFDKDKYKKFKAILNANKD